MKLILMAFAMRSFSLLFFLLSSIPATSGKSAHQKTLNVAHKIIVKKREKVKHLRFAVDCFSISLLLSFLVVHCNANNSATLYLLCTQALLITFHIFNRDSCAISRNFTTTDYNSASFSPRSALRKSSAA